MAFGQTALFGAGTLGGHFVLELGIADTPLCAMYRDRRLMCALDRSYLEDIGIDIDSIIR